VIAGGDGIGGAPEHEADLPTEGSESSDSGSEDSMEGVEEGDHELGGVRELLADPEDEELDVDAFAKELASPSTVTGAVGSRAVDASEEEVAEDAPEDDNRGEHQR